MRGLHPHTPTLRGLHPHTPALPGWRGAGEKFEVIEVG